MIINKCINRECDNDETCTEKRCLAIHRSNNCSVGNLNLPITAGFCTCIARSTEKAELDPELEEIAKMIWPR